MKSFVKKSWSSVALSMLAATGTVVADGQVYIDQSFQSNQPYHDGSYGYHDGSFGYHDGSAFGYNDGSCCSPCGSNFCGSVPSRYGYAYNPPVFIADCCGWTAGIDVLYWKFRQDGISYGNHVDFANAGLGASIVGFDGNFEGQQQYVEDKWDVGFRLAVGYKGPCDCWDVLFTYTHFSPDTVYGSDGTFFGDGGFVSTGGSGSVFYPAYSGLNPYNSFIVDSGEINFPYEFTNFEAEANLKLRFDQLDLDASRQFYVGRCVTLKPVVGLRALWLDEKYNITYSGTTFPFSGPELRDPGAFTEALRFDNEFRGLGLKAGLDSTYALGCGLSVYGSATGALIYGTYNVKQQDQLSFSSVVNSGAYSYQQKDHYNSIVAAADLGIGFSWTQLFNCDKSAFSLRIGYEQHIIFDYNRFRQLDLSFNSDLDNNPGGNLNLYGVVFGAHVGF